MIELLEGRGHAMKLQNLKQIANYEAQIEDLKQFQYYTDIVGVFITYERHQDIVKV